MQNLTKTSDNVIEGVFNLRITVLNILININDNNEDDIHLDIPRYLKFANCPERTIVDRHTGSIVRELIPIIIIIALSENLALLSCFIEHSFALYANTECLFLIHDKTYIQ